MDGIRFDSAPRERRIHQSIHITRMLTKCVFLTACTVGLTVAFSPTPSHLLSCRSTTTSSLKMSFQLDPSVTSFVFIEFQNEFCTEGGKLHDAVKDCMAKNNMLENASKTANAAREAGCTIVSIPGIQRLYRWSTVVFLPLIVYNGADSLPHQL